MAASDSLKNCSFAGLAKEAYITKQFYKGHHDQQAALCLSVLLTPDSFMYAITGGGYETVVELCDVRLTDTHLPSPDYREQIAFHVHNHQLHQKKFSKVYVAVLNKHFTLAPPSYIADNSADILLNFSGGETGGLKGLQHQVKNVAFCFGIDRDLLNYLEKTFPNAAIRHAGAVNIGLLFNQHSLRNCDMLLSVGDSHLELVARNQTGLIYYNVFTFETNEDVLYYLLFMMEQFNLNPQELRLGITCERPVNDELLKTITSYIRHVVFCVHEPGLEFKEELLSQPSHYYFTLLNQHLCEL